jgi:hypothetical protein
VVAAINRIVAAAGQMAATVQVPFLTLCDAGMGYHLPGCLRVLEAAHVVEILRNGLVHVREIAARTGIEQAKLGNSFFRRQRTSSVCWRPIISCARPPRRSLPSTASTRSSTLASLCASSSQSTFVVSVFVFVSVFLYLSLFLSLFSCFLSYYLPFKIFFLLPVLILPPPSPPWPSSTSAPVTRHFSCGTRRSH